MNAFNAYFDEVTSVSLFDLKDAIMKIMYTPEQDPFSLNFQNAGYDMNLFLITGSSFLFNYMLQISSVLAIILMWTLERKMQSI